MEYIFKLKLSREELNHLFWIVYPLQFSTFVNCPGAVVAYKQLAEQLEKYLIADDSTRIEGLNFIKEQLLKGKSMAENFLNNINED